MSALIYVEGPADRSALEALLRPVVEEGRQRRFGVRFLPVNGKDWLLNSVGRKAAGHLSEHPKDWVFALPDLHPMSHYRGTTNAHESFAELKRLLDLRFSTHADQLNLPAEARTHFRTHCLKHDLEALLLAASGPLRERLHTGDSLDGRWRKPVEDQDDDKPPKRVIEALFKRYCKRDYVGTVDAPWILQRAVLDDVLRACGQFALFVNDLRGAM